MDYEHLVKIFYKHPNEYENIYKNRFNSESTFTLPIKIHDYPAFFIVTPLMLDKITKLYSLSNNFDKLLSNSFLKITQNKLYSSEFINNKFLENCLIDEIILTNDIEGILVQGKRF